MPYEAIDRYALIADGVAAALVTAEGSIDWCCMPRVDSGSVFGRLLDDERGGHCRVRPSEQHRSTRRYLDGTLVLETVYGVAGGEAAVFDLFVVGGDPLRPRILRLLEGRRGDVTFDVEVSPRFDYGSVRPWVRRHGFHTFSATGGDDALVFTSDIPLELVERHDLTGRVNVRGGDRRFLLISYERPEDVDEAVADQTTDLDPGRLLDDALAAWTTWTAKLAPPDPYGVQAVRSAIVLKALINPKTGAVVAAPTTSLPESAGGVRNWDYRYAWIRDAQFTVRALTDLGATDEADAFRRFIERSAGGSADGIQIMYGVGGERRLSEIELDLDGYDGARPVRVGNAASDQRQHDVYGYLLDQAWRWHERGRSPDDDYWRFLLDVVDTVVECWDEPDCGIWELRGEPRHLVHSKVMCWSALTRGVQLAEACLRKAPVARWRRVADEIRDAIEGHGVDASRGCFVRAFDDSTTDASLLLIPSFDYVDWRTPRMVATVAAVEQELLEGGLVRRYVGDDALAGEEGTFVAASFWLVEGLAHQGRVEDAKRVFDRAVATSNDLGLFAEEYDPGAKRLLGNFPQGLSHLSHISAALALSRAERSTLE